MRRVLATMHDAWLVLTTGSVLLTALSRDVTLLAIALLATLPLLCLLSFLTRLFPVRHRRPKPKRRRSL